MIPTDPGPPPDTDALLQLATRRLRRAELARAEAEALLEKHSRALDRSNRELRRRETDLVARLEQGNLHLLRAQETAAIASFHMDRDAPPFLSAQFFKIIGAPATANFAPDAVLQLVHPLDRARIAAASIAFFATAATGIDQRYEHRLLHPGGLRWLRLNIRIDRDPDGRFRSVFGTVQDITDPRAIGRRARALALIADRRLGQLTKAAVDLRRAQADTDRAHRAHSRFLAMTSHDIRTPLNGLLGMLDMLATSNMAEADRRKVQIMRQTGDQLRLLVGDIIDIADLGDDAIQLAPVPVRLAALLTGLAEHWPTRRAAQRLTWAVDPDLPEMMLLDARRLRQAIEALLGDLPDRDISVRARRHDDTLRVAFDCRASGTGLAAGHGTIIARRIVQAMDGLLRTDEDMGWWLEIPIIAASADDSAAAGQNADAVLTVDGRRPQVLVAEDIETNRIVLCSMLDRLGCSHAVAVNGADAVAAITSGGFDIVLMDVMMPIMDGAEATLAIRAMPGDLARLPVIGITAHSLQADRERLLALGMDDCIAKPLDTGVLRAALVKALHRTTTAGGAVDAPVFRAAFSPLPAARRQTLLDLVLQDCRDLAREIALATAPEGEEARRRAAHSLKGVAGNFGATAILSALADMAATGNTAAVLAAVARFEAEARALFAQAGFAAVPPAPAQ
jgi:CheY-like chemotaxis protein